MKRNFLLLILSAAVVFVFSSEIWNENGKAGYTGSPAELTCIDCHNTFTPNDGTGSVTVSSNMVNWQYVPGQTYTINLTVARTGNNLFGLGFEALDQANDNAGTLIITDAVHTSIKARTVSGISRRNVVHTLNGGTGTDSAVFVFDWAAPLTNIGDVTFYFAGTATNGNGDEFGDYVYNSEQLVTPMNTTSISENSSATPMLVIQNPSHDRMSITYTLEKAGEVEMELYSLDGKLTGSILSSWQSAGVYTEEVKNIENYPKGIYLLKAHLNGTFVSEKIILQ